MLLSNRRALLPALALLALGFAACGEDGAPTVAGDGTTTAPPAAGGEGEPEAAGPGEGTIDVSLEQTDGIFIEGFEVGLRFTASGDVVKSLLWSDFVASLESTDIEAFYDSVLSQPVPAGTVTVEADVRISPGGAIVPPELDGGPFPCSLDVEVPEGGEVAVEVSFSGEANCISLLGG